MPCGLRKIGSIGDSERSREPRCEQGEQPARMRRLECMTKASGWGRVRNLWRIPGTGGPGRETDERRQTRQVYRQMPAATKDAAAQRAAG